MDHHAVCTCDQCLLSQLLSALPGERRQGWHAWHQRDAPALFAYIDRRCRLFHCVEHSEDILQDCFLIAFRNIAQGAYLDCGKGLLAYIAGIARNRLRELRRRQRREWPSSSEFEAVGDGSLDLDSRLYVSEAIQLVREGCTLRPRLHQQVVAGIYSQGKSSGELAAELGIKAGHVRAIAYRTVHEIGYHVQQQHKLHLSAEAIRACLAVSLAALDG